MYRYEKLFLLLIPIISVFFIFSWFSEGRIISNSSEENLNIFHSQKYAERLSSFWNPVAMGWKSSFNMPSYPTFAFLGFLASLKIPVFQIQALLLGTIMTVGMYSVYFLIRSGLKMEFLVAFIGSLFYLLNIFSMTQIWKRFIYSHMMAWAYLPLFILLWIKWISTGKLTWMFFFLISSLFFANTFANPVFLSTFWVPAGVFVLNELWSERKNKKNIGRILTSFAVGLVLWSIVNIWWLYPTLTLGNSWTAQTGQISQGDFSSLQAVSVSFPLWEVILLRQSWYLGKSNDWFDFYHNPLVIIISVTVLFITIVGALKIRTQRFGNCLIWVSLIGLFISKGTNFPFGYTFFHFIFSAFPLTTALRNSYEKFGVVFLLPYAIFFAFGLRYFLLRLKSKFRHLLGVLIIFLSCVILVYPMWNGDIFPPKHRVSVPTYYIEANDYLKKRSAPNLPNRVFHIPFLLEIEKLTYSWGYVGEDPSDNLFDFEPASKAGIPPYTLFYKQMSKHMDDKNFSKILGLLGIENVIFHKDNIYPKIDLNQTQDIIESWQGINVKKEFGLLTVYSLDNMLINPQIYIVNATIPVKSIEDGIINILDGAINYKKEAFVSDSTESFSTENVQIPAITFRKKSNSAYIVSIKDAKEPFVLVLNSTFDKLWQAKIGKKAVEKHIIVNGFANGWLIGKKGTYDINIALKVWPWD